MDKCWRLKAGHHNAPFQMNLKKFDVKMLPVYLTKNPFYSISEVCKSLLLIMKQKHLRVNRPLYAEKSILVLVMEWAFPVICEKYNQVASNRN